MFALLIKNQIKDDRLRDDILNSSVMLAGVREQDDWAKRWLRRENLPLGQRLAALACAKGIFFQSAFAVMHWFKHRGRLPGFTRANELITRDTILHADFACVSLGIVEELPAEEIVVKMVREAVKIESRFIQSTCSSPTKTQATNRNIDAFALIQIPGISAEEVVEYVKVAGDRVLTSLGYDTLFDVNNPVSTRA